MNHTNNSLKANLTHQELEPPLTSMLAKSLDFAPTPNQISLKKIVNTFKQFRQTIVWVTSNTRCGPQLSTSCPRYDIEALQRARV